MKPRILFILHLPPPVHGAAVVGKNIHDSRIVGERFNCKFINLTAAESLEDIGKFKLRKIASLWHLLQRIRKEVRSFRPDLVYLTPNAKGNAFFRDYVVLRLLRLMKCRVVAHYHNKGVAMTQDRLPYKWLYPSFFKDLKVILLAEELFQDISRFVERKNVFVCPNGIEYIPRVEGRKGNKVPRLLFLSNLMMSKGISVLLETLSLLKERRVLFTCTIVGSETKEIDANLLSQMIGQKNLADEVKYVGPKYNKEKEAIFTETDIFVHPTLDDAFPLVILEAMAYSLPVVSTYEGGIPNIVHEGENGFLFSKGDAEGLAGQLEKLINNEELRKKMGLRGRYLFEENFTISHFETNISDTLSAIINA